MAKGEVEKWSRNGEPANSTQKPKTSQPRPSSFEALRTTIEARLAKGGKQTSQNGGNKTTENSTAQSETTPNTSGRESRGKKRDRNGKVLRVPQPQDADQSDEDEFEKEVRALGGTHEDIDLVADAQSDSEVEGLDPSGNQPNVNKQKDGIEKGMSNILKEISLAQGIGKTKEDSSESSSETSEVEAVPLKPEAGQRKSKSGLRCEVRPDWFGPTEGLEFASEIKMPLSSHVISQLQEFAESLLEEENQLYKQRHQSGSSQSFYNTVITSGTLSDKISALTLAVQESPIHNKKALETLLTLSKKRSRSQAVDVLRALKDLMAQGALLPASRKLYRFNSQPYLLNAVEKLKDWKRGDKLPKGISEQYLIIWAFENWLKGQYFEMLQTLEIWCGDELEFAKSRSMSYVYELLKEKPEQETNLLRMLINKLGDPVKKIASQASYLVMQLLTVHPVMKRIVVSAIETDFIFRPGQSLHGKYYATVTLNQTVLSANEEDVAQRLLGIYFSLFSAQLKADQPPPSDPETTPTSTTRGQRQRQMQKRKKPSESGQAQTDELQEKLTSALLTGVNRAYPYADAEHKTFEEELDTLFRIAHSANFNTSVQAMLLIQQLSAPHQKSSDRFYRLLYESLLDPRLIIASKQQLYLNLLHRSLKADLNARRVKAFVKRILQILSLHEPSFICGAFFLLKDLEPTFPGLTSLIDQAEELDDDEEIFKDVDELEEEPVDLSSRTMKDASSTYDGHKRAPEHANADHSCAWELLPFLAHFHPSVTVSADYHIRHAALPGKPDLTLHTLVHFLDRFVYRNAKFSEGKMRGSSIMQPLASDNTRAVLFNTAGDGTGKVSVNSDAFKAKKDADVAAEDVFFHKYFSAMSKDTKKTKKQKKVQQDDVRSDDEGEVWEAMLNTAPDLEGAEDSDEDEDEDMSDFEAAMDDNSSEGGALDADSADGGVDVEDGFFDDSDEDMGEASGSEEGAGVAQLDSDVDDSSDENSGELASAPTPDKKKHTSKDQRKKLRGLPTFASADDYAKMLDNDEDEDYGD